MTLMGGPVDTRKAPTKVNQFSKDHPMEWFESNVITRVPLNYPGFARRVYPGFLQLAGFMSMNFERHADAHKKLFKDITIGDGEAAAAHRAFYDEYLAVADLPAEFYLQTIEEVFHKHSLPDGQFYHYEHRVRPDRAHAVLVMVELAIRQRVLMEHFLDGKHVDVWETVAVEKPFCKLLHFRRGNKRMAGSKLLLVAPMSGHYATLLRGTVEALLPHHDVYITDWQNARDVPLYKGTFDLNTYIDYLIEFLEHIGPDAPHHGRVSALGAAAGRRCPHERDQA
jgi:poly-beta-hydroxyalkanoate depolymerase